MKTSPRLGLGSDELTGGFLEEGGKWGDRGAEMRYSQPPRATVGMEARRSWADNGAPALDTVLAGLQSSRGVYMATLSPAHRHPGDRESFKDTAP